jgi:hypothetical protein
MNECRDVIGLVFLRVCGCDARGSIHLFRVRGFLWLRVCGGLCGARCGDGIFKRHKKLQLKLFMTLQDYLR